MFEHPEDILAARIVAVFGSPARMESDPRAVDCRICRTGKFLIYRGCDSCGRDRYRGDILNYYREKFQKKLAGHLSSLMFGPDKSKLSQQSVDDVSLAITDSLVNYPREHTYHELYRLHVGRAALRLLEGV